MNSGVRGKRTGHKQLYSDKKHRHQYQEKNCFRKIHKSAIFQYKIEQIIYFLRLSSRSSDRERGSNKFEVPR